MAVAFLLASSRAPADPPPFVRYANIISIFALDKTETETLRWRGLSFWEEPPHAPVPPPVSTREPQSVVVPFLSVGGLSIHHRVIGTPGRPRVAFANSLGSDARIWQDVAQRLAPDFEMLFLDQRGHGLSDALAGPYTIAQLGGDLLGLLDALGWARTSIVGLSVGGLIAQEIAASAPGRLEGLVLMDTAAKIGIREAWAERIRTVETSGLAAIADGVAARWFTAGFRARHPADYAGWRNMLERTPVAGYAATCAALRDGDLTARLAGIRAPTLVLTGADDLSTPPDIVRATADLIEGSRFQLIPDAGHLPCIEQPAAVADAIAQHLQEARHD